MIVVLVTVGVALGVVKMFHLLFNEDIDFRKIVQLILSFKSIAYLVVVGNYCFFWWLCLYEIVGLHQLKTTE